MHGNADGTAGPGAEAHGAGYIWIWAVSIGMSLAALALIRGLHFAFPFSLFAGLALAAVNAGLVLMYFMHLRHETKIFWLAAAYSLVALMFFFFGVFPDIVSAAK